LEEVMQRKVTVTIFAALFLVASVVAHSDDKGRVKGMIKSRSGETMVVQTDTGETTVVLKEETRTKDDRGLFGLDEETGSMVLIPGLKVDVEGTPDDQGRVVAKQITVDGDDLETSEMIQAGVHPTAEQVSANVQRLESHHGRIEGNKESIASNKEKIDANIKQVEAHGQRFANLDDYDVKNKATVKFKTGSSDIPTADFKQLKQLAESATTIPGYLIEVTGYADTTGNAAMNTQLSEQRAKNVVAYLTQQCGVPVRRVVAPGAMGEYGPAASNETSTGRADNRRAEVKVLVNKGIVAAQ
jgi:OOP family OmpA-OmpF porin